LDTAHLLTLINLAYLVAAILFILAFKLLAHPRTAVRGNILGAVGMAIAMVATLGEQPIYETFQKYQSTQNYWIIFAGVAIGTVIGAIMALKVQMTAMPQMVGLLNGFGGAASLLVAGAELHQAGTTGHELMGPWGQAIVATALSGIIGAVTFWGSFVAFAKLQEIKGFDQPGNLAGNNRSTRYWRSSRSCWRCGCRLRLNRSPLIGCWCWSPRLWACC